MDVGEKQPHPLLVVMSTGSTFLENNMNTSQKRRTDLPYIPKFHFLASYTKDQKNYPETSVNCSTIQMAKIWKQSNCPRTDDWIKKKGIHAQWNMVTHPGYRKDKLCNLLLHRWA